LTDDDVEVFNKIWPDPTVATEFIVENAMLTVRFIVTFISLVVLISCNVGSQCQYIF